MRVSSNPATFVHAGDIMRVRVRTRKHEFLKIYGERLKPNERKEKHATRAFVFSTEVACVEIKVP